jgi:lysophospholipase L1-like esterase
VPLLSTGIRVKNARILVSNKKFENFPSRYLLVGPMKNLSISKFLTAALFILLASSDFMSGQQVIKILTLGDSMIEGWMDGTEPETKRKAFRYDLKQLLEGAGYSVDFVGSKSTGCYYFSDCQNGGISGTRDQYLEQMLINGYDPRWGQQETDGPYLDAFQPDVIMINVGTNDITHEPDCIANQRVSAILDQVDLYEARSGKNVMVFLALIINRRLLPNGSQPTNYYTTHQWNLAIKSMAQQRINNGDNLVIVNLEEDAGFNYGYSAGDMCITDPEGLHPSEVGYSKMASLWFQSFIDNYNQAPSISHIPNQTISEGGTFTNIYLDNYVADVEDNDQYLTWNYTEQGTSHLNISVNASRVVSISVKDPNWSGSESVIFTVTDRGHSGVGTKSDSDTVVFKVNAVNDPPVITSQSTLTTIEDTPITLKLSDFTITDPDSDPSTFQLLVLAGSNYTMNGTKVTPAANFNGALSVNVAVRDASDTGPAFQATVNVSSVNDAPVYTGQSEIIINEDESYILNPLSLNYSDADNSNEELTFVLLPGLHYTLDGLTVIPDSNYNGILYVESYIQDPLDAASSVFYIEITVNPVNDEPVFTSKPVDSVDISDQYIYSFLASDPDGEPLTYSVVSKPDWLNFYPNSKLLAGKVPLTAMYINNIVISVNDGHSTVLQTFVLRVKGGLSPVNQVNTDEILVFPNPASDHVQITTIETGNINFKLYNLDGRIILNRTIRDGNGIVYFENFIQPGIYLYSVETSDKLIKGKLVKE